MPCAFTFAHGAVHLYNSVNINIIRFLTDTRYGVSRLETGLK